MLQTDQTDGMAMQSNMQMMPQGAEKPETPEKPSFSGKTILAATAGGLATGAAIVALFASAPAKPSQFEIGTVAQADIAAAAATLVPTWAPMITSQARTCQVPMATLKLSKESGTGTGKIRIRSGTYLSPEFTVTEAPQRIAIPYPAPYPVGHGVLSVEGDASGSVVLLTPGWHANTENGVKTINVVWAPKKPC